METASTTRPMGNPKKSHFERGSPSKLRAPLQEISNPPIQVVGYDAVQTTRRDQVQEVATSAMRIAMEKGSLKDNRYGNDKAFELLNKLDSLEEAVAALQKRLDESLASDDHYLAQRNRFINVYCRDILGDMSKRKDIRRANREIHSENAVVDQELYRQGWRQDEEVFQSLYGLSIERISFLVKNENWHLIRAIDEMATFRANAEKIPSDVDEAFGRVTDLITNRKTFISNSKKKSQVGKAYQNYQELKRNWKSKPSK